MTRAPPLCAALAVLALRGVAAGESHAAPAAEVVPVTIADYRIPAVTLIRADGRAVSLPAELDDGRAVVMNFVFTSCTAICPLMTQTFSWFQHTLGAEGTRVHLVSISIDPEQDTPARLRDYAKRFDAGPGWSFYTGTLAASVATQQAFGVYRGDKMSHEPVTLMRGAPGQAWRRLNGFQTPDELLRAYRALPPGP